MTKRELNNLHAFCNCNKEQIEKSNKCGCFYCLEIFDSKEVSEYLTDNTALCPKCIIDSVLPDASVQLSKEMLTEMSQYWFGTQEKDKRKSKNKKIKKVTYISSLNKQTIKETLQTRISSFCSKFEADFMYDKADEDTIMIGIERGGHSGGYWYVSNLEDCPEGCKIEGEIKYLPEREPYSTKTKICLIIATICFIIPIIILILLFTVIYAVVILVRKIAYLFKKDKSEYKKSRKKEKNLDIFMTEFLCAKKN